MSSYVDHARAWERDPVITPTGLRSEVASGKRGRWGRYNDPSTLIYATNPEGTIHGLTRNQANVYDVIRTIAGTGTRITMRSLADTLRCAPSSVYRALVRLTALGFIAYQSNRGRLGGTVFLLRAARDGLDWCRDEARARMRKAWKASQARISRLRGNVASCFPGREQELYQYRYPPTVTERNIYPDWTPDDFLEAGLM